MNVSAQDICQILEHLALQGAAETAAKGTEHGSMICCLPARSWQADIVRHLPDMPQARSPMELRQAMRNPSLPVIFLPDEAIMTRAALERICAENPLNKTIIWETD